MEDDSADSKLSKLDDPELSKKPRAALRRTVWTCLFIDGNANL
jgi:hypothetical protein